MNKVAEVTVYFWIMKVCATTLGETADDLVSMTMNVGYALSSILLLSLFLGTLALQLRSNRFHPVRYWSVILTTSTAGTTMSDYIDRTLGLGYAKGSLILVTCLVVVLAVWRFSEKTLSVSNIHTTKAELFYWVAILFSNTLGTALGDFLADDSGLGFLGGATLIGGLIAVVALASYVTRLNQVMLFWIAFVLTRPFGATFGDLLTKPIENGGLGFGTVGSSLILASLLVAFVMYTSTREGHVLQKERAIMMSTSQSRLYLTLVVGVLSCLIGLSARRLASQVRFGLEFRGGYEIYYVVSPAEDKAQVSAEDMLTTAHILRQRADSIGMAEPEIHIEGENHIRVKLAGLTSAEESRSLLGSVTGLPTVLTEKYTQTVGSVLGKTALKETITAGAIGVACIVLLLLILYRGMGVMAAFSTLVYLWLLVIVFTAFHATLSLSAVVAFVLGIGMAADASIICFERVREEWSRGHTPVDAVRLGLECRCFF